MSLLRSALFGVGVGASGYLAWQAAMSNDSLSFPMASSAASVLRLMDPERAHGIAIAAAKFGLLPQQQTADPKILRTTVFGRHFSNPIGLAAGFDKHAEAPMEFLQLGFGFLEVGSITPQPQSGNPKPRIFRLDEDQAIINRCGFNSDGLEAAQERLKELPTDRSHIGMIGVNLGKNKSQLNAVVDYCHGVHELGPLADFIVINVSSPNTPGLRRLQGQKELHHLLSAVTMTRNAINKPAHAPLPPLLVKIAPDLTLTEMQDIASVVKELKIDGIIVSNTTIARPDSLVSAHKTETGGLSGKPLFESSTNCLQTMYKLTNGTVPLIGVGGVDSAEAAYRKIRAGASLVELYSALTLQGPKLVYDMKKELALLLERDGFSNVADAVGVDARAQ